MARHFRHPFRTAALAILGCVMAIAGSSPAKAAEEYELKARLLQIMGSHVTWPRPVPEDPSRPFVIGVLGASPFGNYLDEACRGKVIQSRAIKVVYLDTPRNPALTDCSILFICGSETSRLPSVLGQCKGKPIFLMGDTPDFARKGVMLNILVVAGKMALEINLKAARSNGIEISPAFLSLSKGKSKLVEAE